MVHFGRILKKYLDVYKITQSDFADRLGVTQKHMNEIINGNTNISYELMIGISLLTDIDVNFIFFVEQKRKLYESLIEKFGDEKSIAKYLDSFHIKEMNKCNWLVLKDITSVSQNAYDLLEFMNVKDFDVSSSYLQKRVAFKKLEDADLIKAFLWVRRCENLTDGLEVCEYDSKKLNNLFNELNIESNNEFDEQRIINILAKYGIILCIEDALKGTKVRGASMVKGKTPYIFLTRYFKEKSSFYFALYHELAHIKRDYNMLLSKIYMDTKDNEIDAFALKMMISDKEWDKVVKDFKDGVRDFSNYKISQSFIYSRLAYEGYIKYSSKLYQSNIERI